MWYALGTAVVLIGAYLWLRRRSMPRIGEIAPAHVLQKEYGLYAENRRVIKLDPAEVPENLRDLIPMAEKWGIGDDIIRCDFEDKASEIEKEELQSALRGRNTEITRWAEHSGWREHFRQRCRLHVYARSPV